MLQKGTSPQGSLFPAHLYRILNTAEIDSRFCLETVQFMQGRTKISL